MSVRIRTLGLALVLGGALVTTQAGPAVADVLDEYGASIAAGGGVAGFTGDEMRGTADTGGIWDLRAAFGTRKPIAIEAAYRGSAQSIDALGLDTSAILVSNAVEALARVNVLTGELQPFIFVGAAWRRYDLTNADVNTSSVEGVDNLLEVPMGLGLDYRYGDLLLNARGEFRAAAYADLLPNTTGGAVDMHTWGASAAVGYSF